MQAMFFAEDEIIYPTNEQLEVLRSRYPNDKHLYFDMRNIAQTRKEIIKSSWDNSL